MRQIKRFTIFFVALVALFGVINCLAIEPALAQLQGHHAVEAPGEEEGEHCDFICHASHHIWIMGGLEVTLFDPLNSIGLIPATVKESPDPPLRTIFHPPLVFA